MARQTKAEAKRLAAAKKTIRRLIKMGVKINAKVASDFTRDAMIQKRVTRRGTASSAERIARSGAMNKPKPKK